MKAGYRKEHRQKLVKMSCLLLLASLLAGADAMECNGEEADVTALEAAIYFEGVEAMNGSYYNEPRTAFLAVYEHHFDAQAIQIEVTRDGVPYEVQTGSWEGQGDEHRLSLFFTEDGTYTLAVHCADTAGNEAQAVSAGPFTIDCTAPLIALSYEGAKVYRSGYYAGAREAILSVTEHNFDAGGLSIVTGQPYEMGEWTHEGDVHSVTLTFAGQGDYCWSCSFSDLAGNLADPPAEQRFTIDTEAPTITIMGVTDDSANAGEVIPEVLVQEEHYNAESVQFYLENGAGELYLVTPQVQDAQGGYLYSMPIIGAQPDDVYYLTALAKDLAGNEASLTYRFSLNRGGSVYDMSQAREATEAVYCRYEELTDLVITEQNVDQLEQVSLYVTRNGVLVPADEVSYQVDCAGSARSGYVYTYTLYRDNFAEEGTYRVGLYSKDAAGNETNSTLASQDAALYFVVDNTAPRAAFDGVETGGVYNAEAQQVNVRLTESGQLAEAYLYLTNEQGEELQRWDYLKLASEDGLTLTVPEYAGAQSLACRAVDAAGNELCEVLAADFLITTNPWVRLHKSGLYLPIGGVAVAALIGILFLRKRRRGHA